MKTQNNLSCKHKFILTQRIPEIGYYSNLPDGKKELVDLEFVCPFCGEVRCYIEKKCEGVDD